jgi:hypothetical protein
VSLRGVRHEHEFEPQFGLPERLPEGERVLWQGTPALGPMMRHVFHLRALAVYFGLMLVLRAVAVWPEVQGPTELLVQLAWAAALGGLGWGLVAVLAHMTCRSAVYTLTDQRLVIRLGVVLSVTFNLPLRSIVSADHRPLGEGFGDIALKLAGPDRIGFVHLWPHVRPWRIGAPEPMLRCVPQAESVARLLTQAWAKANAQTQVQVRPQAQAMAASSPMPADLPEAASPVPRSRSGAPQLATQSSH